MRTIILFCFFHLNRHIIQTPPIATMIAMAEENPIFHPVSVFAVIIAIMAEIYAIKSPTI